MVQNIISYYIFQYDQYSITNNINCEHISSCSRGKKEEGLQRGHKNVLVKTKLLDEYYETYMPMFSNAG